MLQASQAPIPDQLNTVVHHNCQQIARALHTADPGPKARVLVTGGGALNTYFMEVLQDHLGPDMDIVAPPPTLIAYKEALVFALMGVLRATNATNVLRSVTGARRDSCSGVVFLPS